MFGLERNRIARLVTEKFGEEVCGWTSLGTNCVGICALHERALHVLQKGLYLSGGQNDAL